MGYQKYKKVYNNLVITAFDHNDMPQVVYYYVEYQKYRVSEISDIRNIGYQKYKVSVNISFELSIIYYWKNEWVACDQPTYTYI